MDKKSRPVPTYMIIPHSADSKPLSQDVPNQPNPAEILDQLGSSLPGILADNPNLIHLAMKANPALLEHLRPKAKPESD